MIVGRSPRDLLPFTSRLMIDREQSSPRNPLLSTDFRIPFHRIRPEHVVPGTRQLLENATRELDVLGATPSPPTWETALRRLDAIVERVKRGTGPIQHLLAVDESPALREAWGEVLPELSSFWARLYLHEGVWNALQSFAATPEAHALGALEKRHLEKTLRGFRRSGAGLPASDRDRLEAINVETSQLEQRFSENVLDATAAFSLHILDEERVAGIPDDAKGRFRRRAEDEGKDGWIVTLDHPSYEAVLKHAEDRELRRELHEAFFARGRVEPWDNRPMVPRILELRQEKARILGYPDFPDYRLEEHMAKSGARAREFVGEMVERTRPYWERDLEQMRAFASSIGLDPLEPWDIAFVMERLRRSRFDLDEEELRPYFPLDSVLSGLFEIVHRLLGLKVREVELEEVWHPEARAFEIRDETDTLLGEFYADFFPRPEKRQGAWMNDFISGGPRPDGSFAPHLGVICANFPPPSENRPSLLSHRDVETLFHEFGHLLHHCTSRVPIPERGGVNVAWDWVELPSQLLENWCWERDALNIFARHWQTGEPLPDPLFERMEKAKRFMKGWVQMRQLGFGTFDLELHTSFDPSSGADPIEWVTDLLEPISPNRTFAERHPLPAFLHLFSGGYAAAYYSYLWSEVLEADLFTRFQERGIFDRTTGQEYMDAILSAGDRDDPESLFRHFMGRDPDPEALIRRNLGVA